MEKKETMNNCPKCGFFSSGTEVVCDYKYDEERKIKIKPSGTNFVCGYDGHKINSWYSICPLKFKENKNEEK